MSQHNKGEEARTGLMESPLLYICRVPLYASLLCIGHLPAAWHDALELVFRNIKIVFCELNKPDFMVTKA
ncbi:hypothetical protein JCM10213v2_006179 [Rhodosporidiobolus nylandii]